MRLLAIDCSTERLSVACGDGRSFVLRDERAGQAHAERALPRVREVLAEQGWTLGSLDAIAFGAGPGSFTGVRIACGIAQGLALGAGLPLVPVGTLEALAQEAWHVHGADDVFACLDARMREVYIGTWRREGASGWIEADAPSVAKPDAVAAARTSSFGAGDGFAAYPALAARIGLARVDATLAPTARAIGELAAPRVARGETVGARDARPLYVRHRVALTAAERAAGAAL
ncbi:MAG: tRNA (adenosine(37)-N6)-threonylcarbamoyltransferase complex dimerization subunit type 1 TsaB [Burkholderiales bacterium]|nr:tRNA (adenosine(37)-N6)-threonylcarbamoyltransferase complex dimerization subunit type 1 TsaB [Burkholderiales bacterium]MCE7878217.1 tRNA (adenosine(37)-N6)-threonylcarbamoyltransferase complex dimerization subunit type 1 TsaB [Betaproteobacteria bacterium PRO3]